eukprot:2166823-Rhodomonas_salina.1
MALMPTTREHAVQLRHHVRRRQRVDAPRQQRQKLTPPASHRGGQRVQPGRGRGRGREKERERESDEDDDVTHMTHAEPCSEETQRKVEEQQEGRDGGRKRKRKRKRREERGERREERGRREGPGGSAPGAG